MNLAHLTRPARLLALAALLAPAGAGAQVTRSFELCFTSGSASCTFLQLTTAPFLTGTAIELVVRHDEGTAPDAALRSMLGGFWFGYAGAVAAPLGDADVVDDPGVPLVEPFAEGGAPSPTYSAAWQQRGESSTSVSARNELAYWNTLLVEGPPGSYLTQSIGGCGVAAAGGAVDDAFSTELWSCGGGQYRIFSYTDAVFDVARVNSIGVDTRAVFAGDALGRDAFCTATLDQPGSFGTDGTLDATGLPTFGDVCRARDLDASVVPEPATLALLAGGALPLLAIARRRRQARG